MKYPKFTALLSVATLNFHSNLLGKNHVRLTEEECQKIEDHLAAETPINNVEELTNLQTKADDLQKKLTASEASKTVLTAAISSALELNGLTAETATSTPEESIALLGTKCKEYGSSENRHSFPNNDGKEKPENGLINNVVDMNDPHNQY